MKKDFFKKLVDQLVVLSEYDPELKEGLQWVDKQARERDISFYDMMISILQSHDARQRAKEWMRNRN